MTDIAQIKDKALTTMMSDYNTLIDVLEKGTPTDIFVNKPENRLIINELRNWHKKKRTKPSFSAILAEIDKVSHDKYLVLKARSSELVNTEFKKNEFPYYVEQLKHKWAIEQVEGNIKQVLVPEKPYNTLDDYAKAIKSLGSQLFTVHNDVTNIGSVGESFTTANVAENIGLIKSRDTSGMRRFHLGHDPLDDATGGFLPGEVLMIVGNVNQGKSMVLANVAYHTWYHDNANVLVLTAEMQPEMFDDRIYSRASAVEYSHILTGKTALSPEENKSLDITIKEMQSKPNQIIVRWLDNSDNVNTVSKIIDDYEKLHNFIPDVLIIDSLECLTPAGGATGKDWEDKGQVVIEFKNFAETFRNGRKIFVISTHQAKTITQEKEFKDIDITDMGRSKIVAEKADAAFYLRCEDDRKRMQIKTIKARRFSKELRWNMAYDFSRVLITNIVNDASIVE